MAPKLRLVRPEESTTPQAIPGAAAKKVEANGWDVDVFVPAFKAVANKKWEVIQGVSLETGSDSSFWSGYGMRRFYIKATLHWTSTIPHEAEASKKIVFWVDEDLKAGIKLQKNEHGLLEMILTSQLNGLLSDLRNQL